MPSRLPIPTLPHSYGALQRQPARRMASSRSRPEIVDFSQHVVREHQPALHQLRVLRHRAEDVQHFGVVAPEGGEGAEQLAGLGLRVGERDRLDARSHRDSLR